MKLRIASLMMAAVATLLATAAPLHAADTLRDLQLAAQSGDLPTVQRLVAEHPELLSAKDAAGSTALHAAALARSTETIHLLLEQGARTDAADRDGRTPLHLAARALLSDNVAALIAGKTTPDAADRLGETPLHLAILEGPPDSAAARLRVVNTLLAAGANPAAADQTGATALHMSAARNRPEVLDALLKPRANAGATSGANPLSIEARDRRGRTALHLAAQADSAAVIDWLLAHHAAMNAPDLTGETPLFTAARRFKDDAATRLIRAGASVAARNAQGGTALHAVAGEDMDDADMETAAMRIAAVLLKNGVDPAAKDTTGRTAADIAAANHYDRLTEMLRGK